MEIKNFHDPELSLLQSAVKYVVCHGNRARRGLAADHPAMLSAVAELESIESGAAPATLTVPDLKGACGALLVRYGWARLRRNEAEQAAVRNLFSKSVCDPGWLDLVTDYIDVYVLQQRQPVYRDAASGRPLVFDLPRPRAASAKGSDAELVVGVLGDWGTGEPIALAVLDELFGHRPDVIIHLGDVYYGGSREEARRNFLEPIVAARRHHGLEVPVYNIPGNHDYYTGGAGFYEVIDELNAGQPQGPQGASFFCLKNEHWQLQAMDTGFFDYDLRRRVTNVTRLHDSEAAWHRRQLAEAAAAGRQVMLFSHHQLFSALKDIGEDGNQGGRNFNPHLLEVFGKVLEAGQVRAWFWGHEHRLQVYRPYLNLPAGRGIGHGAIPRFADAGGYEILHPQVPLEKTIQLGRRTRDFYDRGYMVLRLEENQARAEYYTLPASAAPGATVAHTELHSEVL